MYGGNYYAQTFYGDTYDTYGAAVVTLSASMVGASTVTATDTAIQTVAAALAGSATMTAADQDAESLATTITGTGTATASPSNKESLTTAITGAATVTAADTDNETLATSIAGSSLVGGLSNLITNPSFETDINSGWNTYLTTNTVTVSQDVTTSVDGSASLKVVSPSGGTGTADGGKEWSLGVLPAGTYYFSGYVKTDANVNNACFILRSTTTFAVAAGTHVGASTPWTRFGGSFTANGTDTYSILCGLGSYGALSSGTAWFDAIMLEKTPVLNPYHAGVGGIALAITESLTGAATGSGSMTAADSDAESLSAAITGSGSMVGTFGLQVSAAMTGAGSMTAAVTDTELEAAVITGTSTVTGNLKDTESESAAVTGAGSMSTTLIDTIYLSSSMSGGGTIVPVTVQYPTRALGYPLPLRQANVDVVTLTTKTN